MWTWPREKPCQRYKVGKYSVHSQQQGRTFVPFVLDMYGCLAPAALQLIKDIRDESLSSLCGAAHPFLAPPIYLAKLSRTWQFDNASITVQWMTLEAGLQLLKFLPGWGPQ